MDNMTLPGFTPIPLLSNYVQPPIKTGTEYILFRVEWTNLSYWLESATKIKITDIVVDNWCVYARLEGGGSIYEYIVNYGHTWGLKYAQD